MTATVLNSNIIKLKEAVKKIPPKTISYVERKPYNNMVATLSDAILQAGMNYKTVVMPRISDILYRYSNFTSTCDFIILFQTVPIEQIIKWKNKKKQNTLCNLAWLLYNEGVNSEEDFRQWGRVSENEEKLLALDGIGYKTVDYLKLLSGLETIPIDRHLFKFLKDSEISITTYYDASYIFKSAAKELNIEERLLDKIIWDYMSSSKKYF
ncbi:hypothetical protein [Treponema socranskii]|uniref:hypothetical protein n=1 Tax=Treponema socranskii TaxID=53419 RepID=UPI0028E446BF|nr:hypothetical protein [Treponema socranskii]